MGPETEKLLDRTFIFGVCILKFLMTLPDNHIKKIPINHLAKSSTSIGSNYEEAQGAESKRDFIHKIGICYKESRECIYWLRVLKEINSEKHYIKEFNSFLKEALELKNIFGAIKKSSQAK